MNKPVEKIKEVISEAPKATVDGLRKSLNKAKDAVVGSGEISTEIKGLGRAYGEIYGALPHALFKLVKGQPTEAFKKASGMLSGFSKLITAPARLTVAGAKKPLQILPAVKSSLSTLARSPFAAGRVIKNGIDQIDKTIFSAPRPPEAQADNVQNTSTEPSVAVSSGSDVVDDPLKRHASFSGDVPKKEMSNS